MVTVIEVQEQQTLESYEPTVQDKIQRILYRLEHGEKLISKRLKIGDNFCVLGLFADESGLVEWSTPYQRHREMYKHNYLYYEVDLSPDLVEYYNLIDAAGTFYINKVPDECKLKIYNVLGAYDYMSLLHLNDKLITTGIYSTHYINSVLAAVIRSGAAFK